MKQNTYRFLRFSALFDIGGLKSASLLSSASSLTFSIDTPFPSSEAYDVSSFSSLESNFYPSYIIIS